MQRLAGDLRKFRLVFNKLGFDPYSKRDEPGNPLNGYRTMGECDMDDARHPITLAPKDVLDRFGRWEIDSGKKAKGEEGMFHGFRWTMSHEVTHALSYKVGIGYEFSAGFFGPKNPSQFYLRWTNTSTKIHQDARPLGYGAMGTWLNERPEGYPTNKSYFSSGDAGIRGGGVG